jgi:hypothetical protein
MKFLSRKCIKKSETADRHKRIYAHRYLGVDGFYVVDLMTSRCSFNPEDFVSHVLVPMVAKVFSGGESHILVDYNFTRITAESTFQKTPEQFITENYIGRVPHPPCSPDQAPSDIWLFVHAKTSLVGQTFDEPEQLLEAITEFLNTIRPPEVVAVFSH